MPASGGSRSGPSDDVVLQRARAAVVGDGAVLQGDAAVVGEEPLVHGAQLVGAPVDVGVARGLAQRAVRLERGEDRVGVAGRERPVVLADDAGRAEAGVGLEQWRAVRVAAVQRPRAEVEAQLDDALVLVAVGGERQGKADASAVAVEVEDDLLDAAPMRDEEVDVLDVDVPRVEPGGHVVHEPAERALAPDPPADGVMDLGHARERLDERVDLPGHQAVEERHRLMASRRYLSRTPCSAGAEKSSGAQGTPQAFHVAPAVHRHGTTLTGGGDWA
jgi:hypothetical protein